MNRNEWATIQHDLLVGFRARGRRPDGSAAVPQLLLSGGALAATLAQVAAAPGSTVRNLGVSGAIATMMGGFLVTYPHDRIRSLLVIFVFVRVAYSPAVVLIGFWALTQFLSVGVVAQQPEGGVAYAAQVGGFIFGTVTARLYERRNQ